MSSVLDQVPTTAASTEFRRPPARPNAPARTAARPRTAARGTTPARPTTSARPRTAPRRAAAPLDTAAAEVLRTIANSRTPVFITVHANGRRRYGYWRPYDSGTRQGGCYVALPTDVCDRLESAGRITFGEPLVDPAKTTYRVWVAGAPAEPAHAPAPRPARTPAAAPVRRSAAPVAPVTPGRAVAQRLAA